jgi:Protein of unknown function (DUF3800)
VLLAYVDESYTRDRYYIAAVLVPDTRAAPLTRALDQVVARAADAGGVSPDAELHGHDIFQARGDWARWATKLRARISVYHDAFAAIADHGARVIIEAVDIAALRARFGTAPPHSFVLLFLLERIDRHAAEHGEVALVIADEISGQTGHRRDLRLYQRHLPWGDRIVDTLHFAPSSSSRLLQAADLVVFFARRVKTHRDADERAARANQALWARIAPCIVSDHCLLDEQPPDAREPRRSGAQGSQPNIPRSSAVP